ncbi:MAG: glycosyltransferase family 4 protein [Acidobacteriota bacterium]|nr:glycosyltransferase family 4 protein [Acidobacteriota bacterium]
MRIVFISTRADQVGGATVHVRDLAAAMIARGNAVTVLVGGAGPVTMELAAKGVPYRSLGHLRRSPNLIQDVLAVFEIARHLRELKPDLLSTHTAKAGWVGRLSASLTGVPSIFTPHGWVISDRISRSGGYVFRLMEKVGAHFCSRIINVCEYERELARQCRIAPEYKLAMIHNGMPDVPAGLRADPGRDPVRLVMVARMDRPKDHATLLRALADLKDQPWSLEFIGDGPFESSIRKLSVQLGISDRVVYQRYTQEVAERLSAAQVFVLSSVSEAFPRSILEAMRAGLPVVASDVGGVSEAVEHNQTGFLTPKTDSAAMSFYLRRLIADASLRKRMGEAGRLRYERQFTFESMLLKSLMLYDEVLGRVPDGALVSVRGT